MLWYLTEGIQCIHAFLIFLSSGKCQYLSQNMSPKYHGECVSRILVAHLQFALLCRNSVCLNGKEVKGVPDRVLYRVKHLLSSLTITCWHSETDLLQPVFFCHFFSFSSFCGALSSLIWVGRIFRFPLNFVQFFRDIRPLLEYWKAHRETKLDIASKEGSWCEN